MDTHVEHLVEDQLFLSLRTCATHPAGPLRAVAELQLLIERGELQRDDARQLVDRVAQRFAEVPGVPDDRCRTVQLFVAALWR